ncbi:MAGa3780 family membrane protein [Mycoplasmopsis felifaucium]|uniref:Uncharacterized protein n=1 Tax=Mycoplasmopsis felifaucium TaxID=35768 RepID=A0ABZ2RPB7_9BACT
MNSEVKKSNFKQTFLNWKLGYKLSFIFGLALILIDICILINYFNYALTDFLEKTNDSMYASQINYEVSKGKWVYPSALGLMWRKTLTFTEISNFILAITLIVFPFKKDNQKQQAWFFSTIVFITITFLVYWTLVLPSSIKKGVWNRLDLAIPSFFMHAINPILGFIVLIFLRKDITLKHSQILMSSFMILGYFTFGLITFFIGEKILVTIQGRNISYDDYVKYDIVIYPFLNFRYPMFYKGDNIAIKIILNIVIFVLAPGLPIGLAYAWKASLRIKTSKCQ